GKRGGGGRRGKGGGRGVRGGAGHPEGAGTWGQRPAAAATLIETADDARRFQPRDPERLAYITQTTLSVDDTAAIVAILRQRFPGIVGPRKEDICYATTNRQAPVKAIAQRSDALLVVGSANSSNSQRLGEVARRAGCAKARLVEDARSVVWGDFEGVSTLGISAGASAPERVVFDVIDAFRTRFEVTLQEIVTREE